MARETNKLTVKQVEAVLKTMKPGRYRDGGGLRLQVQGSSAVWVQRLTIGGKQRELGLGPAQFMTLKEARDAAFEARKTARKGGDPKAERASALTFAEAAKEVHAERTKGHRNVKHRKQWLQSLETYAFPTLGKKLLSEIQPADVAKVLAPIWTAKPETARRVRQRIGVVLDWAAVNNHRPANLVNAAHPVTRGLPRQPQRKGHHEALPWQDVPAFLVQVRYAASKPAVRLALEFLLLTAARTGEVLKATWNEIDLDAACWTRPAARMKAGVEHRVPLSDQAVAVLKLARERWPNSKILFPGRDLKAPLSDMAMLQLMRRLKLEAVPHGLRSSFRDWCADNRHDRDLAEAALAHVLPNKTEAAYQRSDLFEQRKPLMQAWADFCTGAKPVAQDKAVQPDEARVAA